MSRAGAAQRTVLLLTCEHASNRVPRAYQPLFRGAGRELASHRGWDPGALELARRLARQLQRPLMAARWSRLLVEANRSAHNPRIWSSFTAPLPRVERARILDLYWWPHRSRVSEAVDDAVGRGDRVLHVAVHSFAPEVDGVARNGDVCFLYDSRRKREAALCRRWGAALKRRAPALRVRYNYPFLGLADGLPTWLRRSHSEGRYLGVELEVNQALLRAPSAPAIARALGASLEELLVV